MEDSIRLLVENLKTTDNKIKENAFIKQEISSLKNEYRSRISNQSEEIKRTFLNKLSKYDMKINEIDHYYNDQINLIQNENNKFEEDIRHLKNNLAKEKLEKINADMENIKYRIDLLNMNKYDTLKRNKNKHPRITDFHNKIYEWAGSVKFLGPSILNMGDFFSLLIGPLVFFEKKYNKNLDCLERIDIEIMDLNNSYEGLIREKDIIIEEIDKNSNVMNIRRKIDINIGKINNLEAEKDRLVDDVKRQKNEEYQQLNDECAGEIDRKKYILNGELSNKINDLKSKYEHNAYFLENESEVTYEYQREDILHKLIFYLRNGRASNKKEAVNLYEDEKIKDFEFKGTSDESWEMPEFEKQEKYETMPDEDSNLISKIDNEIKYIEGIQNKITFDPSPIIYKMRQMYKDIEYCDTKFKEKRCSINEYNYVIQRIKSDFKEQRDKFRDILSVRNN